VPIVPGRRFVGLVVTPDGSYVDFVAAEKNMAQPDLWRVPFLGGTPRRLVTGVWSATAWAPDGGHMAFIRSKGDGEEEAVVVAESDGANERVLVTRRRPQRFYSNFVTPQIIARPSWSIDGRSLLVLGFSRLAGQGSRQAELVVIDLATARETRTVPLEKIDAVDAAWLDDRHALVNGVLPGKTPALYRADLVTGALAPVTQDLTTFVGVNLTADRQAAVTMRVDQQFGIWVGDGAGGAMTEIVSGGSAFAGSVALDRVGGLVYGAATTSGTGVFTIGPGQRVPSPVIDNGTEPEITGDGKTIVFQRGGDKPGLYRVNVDGTGLAILAEGSASTGLILPDDRTVLYVSTRSGIQTLWSVALSGGPSRELLHRLLYNGNGTLSASPDGRRLKLLGTVNGRQAALVCDLPDCTNPRDFVVPPLSKWTPDSRGMAFSDSTDPRNIWVQPIDGSGRHPLTKFTEKTILDFAWSPDGKRLAITRGTRLADIVLIKGIR